MKADIHPTLNPCVFIDSSTGAEFIIPSTLTSKKTKKIKGVEHYIITVDVSSDSHPFYTGEQRLVDTAGRVDRFKARFEAAEKLKAETQYRMAKKINKETAEEKIARKAVENTAKKKEEKVKKDEAKKRAAKKQSEKLKVEASKENVITSSDDNSVDDGQAQDDSSSEE